MEYLPEADPALIIVLIRILPYQATQYGQRTCEAYWFLDAVEQRLIHSESESFGSLSVCPAPGS